MKGFKDKVAVIMGAASGIGRALAARCGQEGMNVVLADIEKSALYETEKEMRNAGATVLAVLTDVSSLRDVEALAQKTLDTFGAVHLLCNNAGVVPLNLKPLWENTLTDWEWTMGVNLWGVIYGIRTFVPLMLEQDVDCHIVNTGSMLGLVSEGSIYGLTKHAVVSLSEGLHNELQEREAKIKVSVLCPGWVNTQILDAERNRPAALRHGSVQREKSPEELALLDGYRQLLANGAPPSHVADCVFEAIKAERFWILPHPEWKEAVQARMETILQERNPINQLAQQVILDLKTCPN